MPTSAPRAVLRPAARLGALVRYKPKNHPDIFVARQDLAAAQVADVISRVRTFPGLRPEQTDELIAMLRESGSGAGS